jgi:hypothetical protein
MALGSTWSLTDMSIRNIPGSIVRLALTPGLTAICVEKVEASTSHNPRDLQGLLHG